MNLSVTFIFGFLSTAAAFSVHPLNEQRLTTTFLLARRPFITGNWKLNPSTRNEAVQLASDIAKSVPKKSNCDVALFVPFPFIDAVKNVVGDKISIGAEMVTPEMEGAFTGGISPPMLKSIGVQWVIIGHSERRTIYKESNDYINAQCRSVIEQGMSIVLCVGETFSEFEKNLANEICKIQIKKGLAGISENDMSRVCIAYQPIWAIGTGEVATPEIAQNMHATCREVLSDMYGPDTASKTKILYGGSVGPDSVDGLLSKPDIDGALVGGASLSAESFSRIINFVPTKKKNIVKRVFLNIYRRVFARAH